MTGCSDLISAPWAVALLAQRIRTTEAPGHTQLGALGPLQGLGGGWEVWHQKRSWNRLPGGQSSDRELAGPSELQSLTLCAGRGEVLCFPIFRTGHGAPRVRNLSNKPRWSKIQNSRPPSSGPILNHYTRAAPSAWTRAEKTPGSLGTSLRSGPNFIRTLGCLFIVFMFMGFSQQEGMQGVAIPLLQWTTVLQNSPL